MSMIANATNSVPEAPIRIAWINFTNSVKLLLVPRKNDRPLDQYLGLRDTVFVLVQDKQFLDEMEKAFMGTDNPAPAGARFHIVPTFGRVGSSDSNPTIV